MDSKLQQQVPQEEKSNKPNLTGIPTQMKLDFEQRSGLSFDDVRVHYNSKKPAELGALAYTQGTQVYVGPGCQSSLPHELGHVIQQKSGRVRPTRRLNGLPVNDQPELEREADRPPIQCMPVPALWGIIQMKLPIMSPQKGCNCGYHALARALLHFGADKGDDSLKQENLETTLTAFAIQKGYSVIGEAFNPNALAAAGNLFCRKKNISVKCEVISFADEGELTEILNAQKAGKFIILFPYFFSDANYSCAPTENAQKEENAHWSAIETTEDSAASKRSMLYEGNMYGCEEEDYSTLPLPVTYQALVSSNQSIQPRFSWEKFAYEQGRDQSPVLTGLLNQKLSSTKYSSIKSSYRQYCRENSLDHADDSSKNSFFCSENFRVVVSTKYPKLYQEILDDGAKRINELRKIFMSNRSKIDSFKDVKQLVNRVQRNCLEVRITGTSPFHLKQAVSLAGKAVKVSRTRR